MKILLSMNIMCQGLFVNSKQVIHVGSYRTRAILGLYESLTPPTVKILTRVGIRRGLNNGAGEKNSEENYLVGEDLDQALVSNKDIEIIWPIKQGVVKNWKALEAIWLKSVFFLKI